MQKFKNVIIAVLAFVMLFAGMALGAKSCHNEQVNEVQSPLVNKNNEVAPGIFDDEQGNVYILAEVNGIGASVSELTQKKTQWQKMFPQKKIVGFSPIPYSGISGYGAMMVYYSD